MKKQALNRLKKLYNNLNGFSEKHKGIIGLIAAVLAVINSLK